MIRCWVGLVLCPNCWQTQSWDLQTSKIKYLWNLAPTIPTHTELRALAPQPMLTITPLYTGKMTEEREKMNSLPSDQTEHRGRKGILTPKQWWGPQENHSPRSEVPTRRRDCHLILRFDVCLWNRLSDWPCAYLSRGTSRINQKRQGTKRGQT